jgi:hypothetical protein
MTMNAVDRQQVAPLLGWTATAVRSWLVTVTCPLGRQVESDTVEQVLGFELEFHPSQPARVYPAALLPAMTGFVDTDGVEDGLEPYTRMSQRRAERSSAGP